MNTLFPFEENIPAGFKYYPDFLDESEEFVLLSMVKNLPFQNMRFHGYEAKRKVINYGQDWSFEKRILTKGKSIPMEFYPLIEKTSIKCGISENSFAELLVTEYPSGSVINWHRDAPPFKLICGISLLSDCKFRFRPYNKNYRSRSSIITYSVKRRSLYIMDGPSRSEWEHSISALKNERYSITLRTLY